MGGILGNLIPIPVVGMLIGEGIGMFIGDFLYEGFLGKGWGAAGQIIADTFMGFVTGAGKFGKALLDWTFGGGLLGLLKNVVVWGAILVATVIPALLKAAVALGPWGIAAAAVLGGGIYLATRGKKDEESPDQEMGDDGTTTERTSQSFTTSGGPEADQLKNQMAESRGEETQNFKGGGVLGWGWGRG